MTGLSSPVRGEDVLLLPDLEELPGLEELSCLVELSESEHY
jgi:hypothetical protein